MTMKSAGLNVKNLSLVKLSMQQDAYCSSQAVHPDHTTSLTQLIEQGLDSGPAEPLVINTLKRNLKHKQAPLNRCHLNRFNRQEPSQFFRI